MQDGWIKLYRKLRHDRLWEDKPFSLGQAWIDLLLRANHKEKKVLFGWKTTTIKRGSLIASQRQLARDWGWSKSKIVRFMQLLKFDEKIVTKSDHKADQITILNYSRYQQVPDHKADQKWTRSGPQVDHPINNKNEKNEKNINNIYIYGAFKNVKLTTEQLEKLHARFGVGGTNERIETLSEYLASKGKRYKNHYATILAWERRKPAQTTPSRPTCAECGKPTNTLIGKICSKCHDTLEKMAEQIGNRKGG